MTAAHVCRYIVMVHEQLRYHHHHHYDLTIRIELVAGIKLLIFISKRVILVNSSFGNSRDSEYRTGPNN